MSSFTYSQKTKLDIINFLISIELRLFKNIDPEAFFDQILNLRLLPSTDIRYPYNSDALADFRQHYINNPDWNLEYIFLEHPVFTFLESDEVFTKLLNIVISPQVNINEDEIKFFYHSINPILERDNLEYKVSDYSENNLTIYLVSELNKNELLKDIPDNDIPFYIRNKPKNADITIKEYFILTPTSWDDFGWRNEFELDFYKNSRRTAIGKLKIIDSSKENSTKTLNNRFTQISENYCSLAEKLDFYKHIKEIFPKKFLSILKALNDVAFFSVIEEKFEDLSAFSNSLIRYDEQEQLMRQAKFQIDNYDLDNLYTFSYKIDEDSPIIEFSFRNNTLFDRVYAIIGKNGVGKTRLISQLPTHIAKKSSKYFSPRIPLFSKIIAVSYSAFDKFNIPNPSSHFNYVYCGLRKNTKKTLDQSELENRFYKTIDKLLNRKRTEFWINICDDFFSKDIASQWIDEDPTGKESLNQSKFQKSLQEFSSGQSIFIFIMTEILANIRFNSLIIFDEPETHLHPNGISQLINSIHLLAEHFKSYCIIATHSPIVIQGLLSNKVYVLRNDNGITNISHPMIETFGENLTVLTEEIFGTRDIPNYFVTQIKKLVDQKYTYEQILDVLQKNKNIPLSLNVTILLKSLMK